MPTNGERLVAAETTLDDHERRIGEVEEKKISKSEFQPVRAIVYFFVTAIGLAVMALAMHAINLPPSGIAP